MIVIFALIVVFAALLQVIFASLTVFGVLPLITLLVAAWLSYRFGALLALPLMLLAGFVLSFFALAPALTILAYAVAGAVIIFGISASTYEDDISVFGSVLVVLVASLCLALVANISALPALNFAAATTFLLLTALITAFVWRLIIAIASPK